MIDPFYWQESILRYAALLLDDQKIWRSWVDDDRSETSVIDFYELYEQIFDDLDADAMVEDQQIDPSLKPLLLQFLSSIKRADEHIEADARLKNPRELLRSNAWVDVKNAAKLLIDGAATSELRG